ncbi:DNA invertase Pin-like site-specific DNA recombinase [Salana multivorans]|uniref:DNA invertase Pin-like site-specific DNA recombinase n=1 Tax=Salana multivorans TaxID=120377 RepID=A0A3N2D6R8_9MICO|nr:recombinase family protein [Salana multivorans]ROR95465.1 DNA invertase Pin-like site-specific DNA recombinase [Salana multivorans]ROR95549.1 DNA invertase Pin-like site-specific DNA recombinase [Salana multivorans]
MDVALYVRISLDRYGNQEGVENQREALVEWCSRQGWRIVGIYEDNDISATTGARRPGFEALLRSGAEAIAVWHTDRLVRTNRDLERVIELGINVYAKEAGHLDLSTPAGRAVARTVTAWAQYEGEQKAIRQRLSNAARARKGKRWWATRPYGNEMDGSLNQAEAAVIQRAAGELIGGASLYGIAKRLNEEGHPTARGGKWTGALLRQVLQNPRIAGVRVYDGVEVGTGDWEAPLDMTTWRTMKAILDRPERNTNPVRKVRKHLLVSLATCGVCGSTLKSGRRRSTPPRRAIGAERVTPLGYYLTCSSGYHVMIPEPLVDDTVEGFIFTLVDMAEIEDPDTSTPEHGATLVGEAAALRERLTEAAASFAEGVLTIEQLGTITTGLRGRLEEIERSIAETEKAPTLARFLAAEDAKREWGRMSLDEKRQIIDRLVQVSVHPAGKGRRYGREHVIVTLRRSEPGSRVATAGV